MGEGIKLERKIAEQREVEAEMLEFGARYSREGVLELSPGQIKKYEDHERARAALFKDFPRDRFYEDAIRDIHYILSKLRQEGTHRPWGEREKNLLGTLDEPVDQLEGVIAEDQKEHPYPSEEGARYWRSLIARLRDEDVRRGISPVPFAEIEHLANRFEAGVQKRVDQLPENVKLREKAIEEAEKRLGRVLDDEERKQSGGVRAIYENLKAEKYGEPLDDQAYIDYHLGIRKEA